jgi:hypothetical protein
MQQHLMQMQPMMAAYYPNNVTTDHIQQVSSSPSPFCSISIGYFLSVLRDLNLLFCHKKNTCDPFGTFSASTFFFNNYYVFSFSFKQYLDENKSLILKIVESQNSGKLTECAE